MRGAVRGRCIRNERHDAGSGELNNHFGIRCNLTVVNEKAMGDRSQKPRMALSGFSHFCYIQRTNRPISANARRKNIGVIVRLYALYSLPSRSNPKPVSITWRSSSSEPSALRVVLHAHIVQISITCGGFSFTNVSPPYLALAFFAGF